jgi:hypothetical protein
VRLHGDTMTTKDASRMKMKMAGAIGKLSVGVAATL